MTEDVSELLAAALERNPSERESFLDSACRGDPALRREIASLLAAHARPGPMDSLGDVMAPLTRRLRTPAESLTGRVFGSYEVGDQIGGGGMGVVYRGIDRRSGSVVALKFLRPGLDADATATARFRLEANTVAALDHPNICAVHEIGETPNGHLFIVMPLYEGETLKARIARGPLPSDEAVAIAARIARALGNVHVRGIIHRDIKPSNVLLTGAGDLRLLDFGVAKLAGHAFTAGKKLLGTLAYMSPEQIASEPVDQRTDLWSLGVVLYEMVAGTPPFPGKGPALVNAIMRAEVRAAPGMPSRIERVVRRALVVDRSARYAAAEEVERDLNPSG